MKYGGAAVFVGIALALLFAAPTPTFAINATFFGPIVPAECHCDNQQIQGGSGKVNTAPDYGCVLQTMENILNFGISLSIILFTIFLVYTGFLMVVSGGKPDALQAARNRFLNVFVGLAVVLCAWLIVDYVMKTVYDQGKFGPWNAILEGSPSGQDRCIIARNPRPITAGQVAFSVPSGTSATGGGGGATPTPGTGDRCTGLPDSSLVPIDNAGHKLSAAMAQNFINMRAAAAAAHINLVVASAYRSPEQEYQIWQDHGCSVVNGRNSCSGTVGFPCQVGGQGSNHSLGDAVDISNCGGNGALAWLQQNAAQFNFHNHLPRDLCHWSASGG